MQPMATNFIQNPGNTLVILESASYQKAFHNRNKFQAYKQITECSNRQNHSFIDDKHPIEMKISRK